MIKAIIFDLDGLLIDSEPLWAEADRAVFREWGIDYHGELKEMVLGRGQREGAALYIKHFNLKISVEDFVKKRWEAVYPLLEKNLTLMPGAKELVEKLFQEGFTLALATGGHEKVKAEEILAKLSLRKFFPVVVSGLEVKHSKPAPDLFLLCAQKLGLSPSQCLVLEDAPNGVVAAKRAEMKVIGVNPVPQLRVTLKAADLVVKSLSEVTLKVLKNL